MVRVRLADIPDINGICGIALELLEGSVYNGVKPDEQKFRLLLASSMGRKTGIVYVIVDDENIPQGFMIGAIEEYFFSRDRFATDLCIYVRKAYRAHAPSMIRKFIAWAQSKPRVKEIAFGISSGMDDTRRTGEMYESLGLKLIGGLYSMRVNP